jgi:hypothetical protein
VNNGDGTQTMTLITPLDQDVALTAIHTFGLLRLVRFTEDELKFSHITSDLSQTSISFTELVQDYRNSGDGDS